MSIFCDFPHYSQSKQPSQLQIGMQLKIEAIYAYSKKILNSDRFCGRGMEILHF